MSSSPNATIFTRENLNSNRGCGTHTNKRQKFTHEIPSSYKGLILHQNSNFGSYIYSNNSPNWLGTFKSGLVYDSATLKLQGGGVDRNLPLTNNNLILHEQNFQKRFTDEAIVNMVRDGSYNLKLANYVNSQGRTEQEFLAALQNSQPLHSRAREEIFRKELTPSDVGKLNRLVIPKQAAVKYFLSLPAGSKGRKPVELAFHDGSMRIWKFGFSYSKSSQMYAFTQGWNEFVNVNKLRSQDVLTFSRCKQNNENKASFIHFIEVTHINHEDIGNLIVSAVDDEKEVAGGVEGNIGMSIKVENEDVTFVEKKGFRLFGVHII